MKTILLVIAITIVIVICVLAAEFIDLLRRVAGMAKQLGDVDYLRPKKWR